MRIDLRFTDTELHVVAIISLKHIKTKEFNFILNNNLKIEEIKCNAKIVKCEKTGEVSPTFRSLSQCISISSEYDIEEIIIKYSGSVFTWHNNITREIKALSWYSVWYPQKMSHCVCSDAVYIHGCEDYYVVKASYDKEDKVWKYGSYGYDPYNIIAYKKDALRVISNQYINIYYVNDEIGSAAQSLEKIYLDILRYYNGNLFEKAIIEKLDIACLSPAITYGGAYKRKDLIVCDTLETDVIKTTHMVAHEMAHIWCCGANSDSWEDWLNEATAEWSWILYVLNNDKDEIFDNWIRPRLEESIHLKGVKTEDGSRPNDVHIRASVLLYKVYKEYGKEIVYRIVQIFTQLESKTTENLLKVIRDKISLDVAMLIEREI